MQNSLFTFRLLKYQQNSQPAVDCFADIVYYDLIFIDAPLGGISKIYSRIDILSIIPKCLSEHFVIIVDDYIGKAADDA